MLVGGVPFARVKLMTNQLGIWSIALNVLLNRYESSIVRTQACAFLVNLTQSILNNTATTAVSTEEDADVCFFRKQIFDPKYLRLIIKYRFSAWLKDTNLTVTGLQYILNEFNFYHQVTMSLTMFYPFDTYSFNDLIKRDDFNCKLVVVLLLFFCENLTLLLRKVNFRKQRLLNKSENLKLNQVESIKTIFITFVRLFNRSFSRKLSWTGFIFSLK